MGLSLTKKKSNREAFKIEETEDILSDVEDTKALHSRMVSVRGPKHRNHLLAVELINCPPASPEMGNTKGRNAVDDI